MKRKILFVNLFPEIGGAETSLIYLLQKLNKKKFDPVCLLPKKGYFSQRLKSLRVKVHFIDLPGFSIRRLFIPGADPIAIWKFYKFCKKLKPDLIHLTHLTQAVYAGVVSRLLRIPVVALSWMNSDSIYFYQDVITNTCVNKVVAVSPKLAKRIKRRNIVDQSKVEVLTPGVDTNFFVPAKNQSSAKKQLGIPKKSIVITIASRFDSTKDHLTFFRAMKAVINEFPNIQIVVAQDPKVNLNQENSAYFLKEEINSYLGKNPLLKDKTLFVGYQKNMLPIYQATDILVSSSLYESLGMILMEAASCGIPIVSTNFDGQHLIIKNGKTGFLVPIKSPKKLAKKILVLAKNESLRKKFGKEARSHIVKNFPIQIYASEIGNIYEESLSERRR